MQQAKVICKFSDHRRSFTANYILIVENEKVADVYQRGPRRFEVWRGGLVGVYDTLEQVVTQGVRDVR